MNSQHGSLRSVFAMPLVIGVSSAAGLLAALLLEPLGRYFAWFALSVPIVAVIWAYRRKRSQRPL